MKTCPNGHPADGNICVSYKCERLSGEKPKKIQDMRCKCGALAGVDWCDNCAPEDLQIWTPEGSIGKEEWIKVRHSKGDEEDA